MEESGISSNLSKYLKALGITDPKNNYETLQLIAELHPIQYFYQNLGLYLIDRPCLSLNYDDLIERLVDKKLGGLCFEHMFLQYFTLKEIGFKVGLIPSKVYVAEPSYSEDIPFYHGVLVVEVENKSYLIEGGYATWSFSGPVQIDFSLSPGNPLRTTLAGDNYIFEAIKSDSEFYVLSGQIYGEKWYEYFAIPKDLCNEDIFSDSQIEKVANCYQRLLTDQKPISIRDEVILIGKNTSDGGRIQMIYFPLSKKQDFGEVAYKIVTTKGHIEGEEWIKETHRYNSFNDLQNGALETFGYAIPDQKLNLKQFHFTIQLMSTTT